MKSALSVMLVDDDRFIREVVGAALAAHQGVSVSGFDSAAEALSAARIARPDVIVLDYTLPGTDGISLARELRGILSPMPRLIFLTAREDFELVGRLHAEGAEAVLAKRFDPVTIAQRILRLSDTAPRDTRLDAVAAGFRASLPETMAEIEKEWGLIRRTWQRPVAESLLMRVHKLAGAAGLFKLEDFGNAARGVEVAINAQLGSDAPETSDIERSIALLWERAIAATGS